MIDAPASAASMDAFAISAGVMGKYSDIVGVWMPPVGAQVMMTGFCHGISWPHLLDLGGQDPPSRTQSWPLA